MITPRLAKCGLAFGSFVACLVTAGCGPKLPQARYVDSPAFHSMSGSIYGILERDVNQDQRSDAAVMVRTDSGYVVEVLHQEVEKSGPVWKSQCTSEPVVGDDLDAMRWLKTDTAPWLYVLVLSEDPEQLVQSVAVVDVRNCALAFREQLRLERNDNESVLAPEELRSGATLDAEGTLLTLIDQPSYLRLTGATNDVRVVAAVRQRRIVWPGDKISSSERRLGVLAPATIRIDGVSDPASLVDSNNDTQLQIDAGQEISLRLLGDQPLVLLELRHGCGPGTATPLALSLGSDSFTLGERPSTDSFVQAVGIGHEEQGMRFDLLALRRPATELTLTIAPSDTPRCLRELRPYGFGPGSTTPSSDTLRI